jgi:hypothetical protein
VHGLGEIGALQFTDLNPEQTPFQRRYVNYVKRCDELERKLRFIIKEIDAFGGLSNLSAHISKIHSIVALGQKTQ